MCVQEIAYAICVVRLEAELQRVRVCQCSVSAQQEVEIADFLSFDTFPLLTLQRNWQFPTFEHFIFYTSIFVFAFWLHQPECP